MVENVSQIRQLIRYFWLKNPFEIISRNGSLGYFCPKNPQSVHVYAYIQSHHIGYMKLLFDSKESLFIPV